MRARATGPRSGRGGWGPALVPGAAPRTQGPGPGDGLLVALRVSPRGDEDASRPGDVLGACASGPPSCRSRGGGSQGAVARGPAFPLRRGRTASGRWAFRGAGRPRWPLRPGMNRLKCSSRPAHRTSCLPPPGACAPETIAGNAAVWGARWAPEGFRRELEPKVSVPVWRDLGLSPTAFSE